MSDKKYSAAQTLKICLFFILIGPLVGLSQTSSANTSPATGINEEETGVRNFAGLRFGIGLSLTVNDGKRNQVQAAEIVSGTTRVTFDRNRTARIMLESHYFFTPMPEKGHLFNIANGDWGIGPFVAVQPGSEEIIDAIGAGFMIGFKRAGSKGDSWNFGVGLVVDPNVQVLGDGFIENAVPPEGESQVRFKQTSATSMLLLTSFSF